MDAATPITPNDAIDAIARLLVDHADHTLTSVDAR
jgi:hypothetical protein